MLILRFDYKIFFDKEFIKYFYLKYFMTTKKQTTWRRKFGKLVKKCQLQAKGSKSKYASCMKRKGK